MKTTEYNKELFMIADTHEQDDCLQCMLRTNYSGGELAAMGREAVCWDGSNYWADVFYLYDLIDMCAGSTKHLIDLIEKIAECGNVDTDGLYRYDSCGDLECLTQEDFEEEAFDHVDELAEFIIDNLGGQAIRWFDFDPDDEEILASWEAGYTSYLCANEECEQATLEYFDGFWVCPICGCSTEYPTEDGCELA